MFRNLASAVIVAALSTAAIFPAEAAKPAKPAPVEVVDTTVNGVKVVKYTWQDSKNRPRTVSIKLSGQGNAGPGGYAIQMTYDVKEGTKWRTVTANATPGNDGGFGYFVSHERYRNFKDNDFATIAGKVFGADDSPLGRGFPSVGTRITSKKPGVAAYKITLDYPRYGTATARPLKFNNDVDLPTDKASFRRYNLPITIVWVFQTGRDYPRIRTKVDLSQVGGPDRVSFDVRGPYGVLDFDDGGNNNIRRVMWGDSNHFATRNSPVTYNSGWTWTQPNTGARYHALIAGDYEMGLFEPVPVAKTKLRHPGAEERGFTSSTYDNGGGCKFTAYLLPCSWVWPYQSVQFSLNEATPKVPTTFEKIAWGSTNFYGTGPSVPKVPETNQPFVGFPASKAILYDVCVVLGKTKGTGITRAAAAEPTKNCATGAY